MGLELIKIYDFQVLLICFSAFGSQTQTERYVLNQRFLPNSVKYIIYRPAIMLRSILPHTHFVTFFQKLQLHSTIN